MKKTITYGEIENGMRVWNQGHLFLVSKVTRITGQREDGKTVICYTGHCVSDQDDIKGTGYDGGRYGAVETHPATVEIDE